MKTVVVKGKVPVDAECTAKLGTAHVFVEGKDIYDVMLNQVCFSSYLRITGKSAFEKIAKIAQSLDSITHVPEVLNYFTDKRPE